MKLISIVIPCFNEEANIEPIYNALRMIAHHWARYDFEILFIDNASSDGTVPILKRIAAQDKRVKVILNRRNFGLYRSPLHGLLQARGDAIIPICADFQDPPELINEFLKKWEDGFRIVAAVKTSSEESRIMYAFRTFYYNLIAYLSETEQIRNFTGYGLYDRMVIDLVKSTGDHYPYLRGLVMEMGFEIARVEYVRPQRKQGRSKNSLYDLYTFAINGIVNQSKLPLRLATFVGFLVAVFSAFVALVYFVYKLVFWDSFKVGTAPLVIGLFFFSAVQLIFLGIIGEYIGAIHARLFQRWLVIEKERINFD